MRHNHPFFRLPVFTVTALAATATLGLCALPKLTDYLDRHRPQNGRLADNTGRSPIRSGSPFSVVLGEMRASVGDTIFMKTEIYLHEGVNYITLGEHDHKQDDQDRDHVSPADTATTETATSDTVTVENAHPLDHEDVENMRTAIPKSNDDFRGIIGQWEREIKPWRAEHKDEHGNAAELIPWYRIATLADPKNTRCYIMGAYWLASSSGGKKYAEAEQFIREGLVNNPGDFQLLVSLGSLLHSQQEDARALDVYKDAFKQALAVRPTDGEVSSAWTVYQENDAATAAHMTVLLTRDIETTAAAKAIGHEYLRLMPGLQSLQRIVDGLDK